MSNLLVSLGPNPVPTLSVTMEMFYSQLHQAPTAPKNDHVFNVEIGMYTDPNNACMAVTETDEWLVYAHPFSFSLGCVAAVTHIEVFRSVNPEVLSFVYGLPMQLEYHMVSNLKVTVTEGAKLDALLEFGVIPTIEMVPKAVWAKCEFIHLSIADLGVSYALLRQITRRPFKPKRLGPKSNRRSPRRHKGDPNANSQRLTSIEPLTK